MNTLSAEAPLSSRPLVPPAAAMRTLMVVAGVGGLVFLMGLLVSPQRAWGGYLVGYFYFVGLALAGPLCLAILQLSGARWALPLRRIPNAMSAALPSALILGIVLITGTHALYEWSHAEVVQGDALLTHKSSWLNVPGFSIRLLIYFGVWIWLARRLSARLTAAEAEPQRSHRDTSSSALFMALFAITFSLASVDWLQSLDPHWFSTMFALRTLSGVGSAGVAVCVIVLVALRRNGRMRAAVTKDVLDDLGKILLALTVFWGYIWYCQYMIIWYTNMPEETGYYLLRRQEGWGSLWTLNMAVNFAVPFLFLMLRTFRRNGIVLMRIAAWILFGHALDLYVLIAPPLMTSGPQLGLWELGPLAGALALFAWLLLRQLGAASRSTAEAGAAR